MNQITPDSIENNLLAIQQGQEGAVASAGAVLPVIKIAVDAAVQRLSGTQGRIIYIGAGTPGRMGVQDGVELKPTYGWLRVAFALAGGDAALQRSV